MKDIRRLGSVRFFPVRRRLFYTGQPLEWRSIGIDIQGRPGNGGEAKVFYMVGRSDEGHAD